MTTQSERELTAARWLIEQDDPAFSDAQRAQLAKWLMQSYENCDTYIRMVRTWRWTVLLYEGEPPLAHSKQRRKPAGARGASPRLSARMIALNRRLGALLRSCREAQGLSQSELAAKSSMRVDEINEIEAGASTLSFLSACLLSRGLEIAPSRLVSQLEKAMGGETSGRPRRKSP
jgi:ferric-dicitrate binding protein FerR (iron transport regulator)